MNLQLFSYLLPLVFLLYQIIIDFVDLFPFNDVHVRDKRLRKFEVLGNYPPLLIISACFYFGGKAAWFGLGMTSIIMIMHLFAWWFPYFFGFPKSVRSDYEKYFARTLKILPPIKNHIVPDVEHIGVGVILTITLITQCLFLF